MAASEITLQSGDEYVQNAKEFYQKKLIDSILDKIKSHIDNIEIVQKEILRHTTSNYSDCYYLDTDRHVTFFPNRDKELSKIDNQKLYDAIVKSGYLFELETKLGHPFKMRMWLTKRDHYFDQTRYRLEIKITWYEPHISCVLI